MIRFFKTKTQKYNYYRPYSRRILFALILFLSIFTNSAMATCSEIDTKIYDSDENAIVLTPLQIDMLLSAVAKSSEVIEPEIRDFYWIEISCWDGFYHYTFFDKEAYRTDGEWLGEQSTRHPTFVFKFNTDGRFIRWHGVK